MTAKDHYLTAILLALLMASTAHADCTGLDIQGKWDMTISHAQGWATCTMHLRGNGQLRASACFNNNGPGIPLESAQVNIRPDCTLTATTTDRPEDGGTVLTAVGRMNHVRDIAAGGWTSSQGIGGTFIGIKHQ